MFAHGTLTASMQMAPPEQIGLALGAWGAVQASAAGLAIALGGILREFLAAPLGITGAYVSVYGLEQLMLLGTLAAMWPLARKKGQAKPMAHAVQNRASVQPVSDSAN